MEATAVQHSLLIVEDSDEDFEAARRALRKLGVAIAITRCTDGDDALDLLHRRGAYGNLSGTRLPGLVLLDLNLPSTDGREVLTEIKRDATLKSIPVVILTTSANPIDIEVCYRNGANSYLVKPVNMTYFTKVLKLVYDYWFGAVVLPEARA